MDKIMMPVENIKNMYFLPSFHLGDCLSVRRSSTPLKCKEALEKSRSHGRERSQAWMDMPALRVAIAQY